MNNSRQPEALIPTSPNSLRTNPGVPEARIARLKVLMRYNLPMFTLLVLNLLCADEETHASRSKVPVVSVPPAPIAPDAAATEEEAPLKQRLGPHRRVNSSNDANDARLCIQLQVHVNLKRILMN
uniref:Uncharacterized protein n=1 Tax=Trichuris muris TaxID=70415 RepID=A0A5S6Q939_TRIMR